MSISTTIKVIGDREQNLGMNNTTSLLQAIQMEREEKPFWNLSTHCIPLKHDRPV